MAELHPFFVHFPVALIMVAVIFDVFGAVKHRQQEMFVAFMLQILGSVFGIMSAFSGNLAEAGIRSNSVITEAISKSLDSHVSVGNLAVWIIIFCVGFRLFAILEKKTWAYESWLFPTISIGLALIVLYTGLLGGELSRDVLNYFIVN